MGQLKRLVLGALLAGFFSATPALAEFDWHRSTGGVPPQAEGDDFYFRGTGGVPPQAVSNELFARGSGGMAPQPHAE
jgi:hypothetical protein